MSEPIKKDNVIKNITISLWITTITGIIAIALFIFAYTILKALWLLIVPIFFLLAILLFHYYAGKIKRMYLANKQDLNLFKKVEEKN